MQNYSKIIELIKTVEERNELYSEIDLVSQALFREGELKNVLENQISIVLKDYIGEGNARELISDKLSELKKLLDGLEIVKLNLAFEHSESTVDKIIAYLRKNLSEKIILEIHYEPNILGGVIFEFKGIYRDYTLKTKLEEVFKNKKEKLFTL